MNDLRYRTPFTLGCLALALLAVPVLGCGGGSGTPPPPPPAAAPDPQVGTLATTAGTSITDTQLRDAINKHIPAATERLLIFTQCYGGDCVDNFAGDANTAVGSATQPGQEAMYGGYDDDAADALDSGAGRTGQTVHDAGVAGKDASETPTTGGGMGLGMFSLEDITATSAVQSRHVLVYAGKPDPGMGRDNDQRDQIRANFMGDTNTSVTTVGGAGGDPPGTGWDHPGSAAGLEAGLMSIGTMIAASPDPAREQFILFVTDHGDLDTETATSTVYPPVAQGTDGPIVPLAPSFLTISDPTGEVELAVLNDPTNFELDPAFYNHPGFGVFLDANASGIAAPVQDGNFPQGSFRLHLTDNASGQNFQIDSFFDVFYDIDVPGTPGNSVGDQPGEGILILFPTPDMPFFVDSFFDVDYQVEIQLLAVLSGNPDLTLTRVTATTGEISK